MSAQQANSHLGMIAAIQGDRSDIDRKLSNNELDDVRLCLDWDTGTSIREMKNDRGEWLKVGNE
jgi:hypothetical protein